MRLEIVMCYRFRFSSSNQLEISLGKGDKFVTFLMLNTHQNFQGAFSLNKCYYHLGSVF